MSILQRLYNSEINFAIRTFWDGGFDVMLGDPLNGIKATANTDTLVEAEAWLEAEAVKAYPESVFARESRHDHVRIQDSDDADTCARCGHDIRHPIHRQLDQGGRTGRR